MEINDDLSLYSSCINITDRIPKVKYQMSVEDPSNTNIQNLVEENKNNPYLCIMIDVSPIYGYIGSLKHEPYGDLVEYQKCVKDSEIAFRNALTQCVLEKDGKGTILFLRDFQDLAEALRGELDYALKGKDNGKIEWLSFQAMKSEEAVKYINRVREDMEGPQVEKPTPRNEKPVEVNRFAKKLEEYGELLSVKDLTDIFGCTPRTITNWESKGWIVNVAETSEEINVVGRKKRGQEKRYRKESILRSIALQEKYNDKG